MNDLPKGWWTSKTIWASLLTTVWPLIIAVSGALHITLPAPDSVANILASVGTVAMAAIAIYGRVTAKAPIAKPSTPAVKTAALAVFFLAGCVAATLPACTQAQQAAVAAAVTKNAASIQAFCTTKVLPVATSPLTLAALMAAGALPYGADFTLANNSVIAACNNIDAVAQSATTLPWMQSQLPVIVGAGKVAPPAPIAPAPITAATVPAV